MTFRSRPPLISIRKGSGWRTELPKNCTVPISILEKQNVCCRKWILIFQVCTASSGPGMGRCSHTTGGCRRAIPHGIIYLLWRWQMNEHGEHYFSWDELVIYVYHHLYTIGGRRSCPDAESGCRTRPRPRDPAADTYVQRKNAEVSGGSAGRWYLECDFITTSGLYPHRCRI